MASRTIGCVRAAALFPPSPSPLLLRALDPASLTRHPARWLSGNASPPKTTTTKPDETPTTPPPPPVASRKKESAGGKFNLYGDEWEDTADFAIQSFEELPHRLFGANQHMIINHELKEALRLMLYSFNAPIVYCFAYGSGVFPQAPASRSISEAAFRAVHPKPPEALVRAQKGSPKMIDFIFGVSHTEHWHSVNMKQHRGHYSAVAALGSGAVSRVQAWGAGVYFNPYVEMNGMLIKYGVTSIDNLVRDLSTWDNLYLAGRLQKPVKILRDHPRVRLANQANLLAALRTALLLLPPAFSESDLYAAVAGLSYLGDPRMALPAENRAKVANIVANNMVHFRRLYAPLVRALPNVDFADPLRLDDERWVLDPSADARLLQDMDPAKRANMLRRLPRHFRARLYFRFHKLFALPQAHFDAIMAADDDFDNLHDAAAGPDARRHARDFERRIATDGADHLRDLTAQVIRQTVNWPSSVQSAKGLLMGGWAKSYRYMGEKMANYNKGRAQDKES